MPQMGAREWAEYRLALMQAAQKSGRPELVQQVNDSVTKMQHDGFMSYGQQALALLQAGDEDGAKKALVAAYSHFPNGTNVKFAVQGSQLVGYGVDEQTGKPKGAMAITPEMLDRTLRNFQNPQAFATWTVDRQNAMSQAKNADTNAYRAETDRTTGLGNLAVNQGELGVKRALLPSQILGNQAQAAYHTSQALYPKTGRSALGGDGEGGGLNDNDMRDFDQKANDMAYMIAMRSGDSEGRTVSEIKSVAAALYAREPMNPARALQRTEQIFALQGPAREQALRMVMGQQ